MKDMLCEAKNKINDTKEIVLDRSIDMRMSIARKGELDKPLKSFCVHRSCNTPLWKIALILFGIAAGMIILCKMCNRKKCSSCDECE